MNAAYDREHPAASRAYTVTTAGEVFPWHASDDADPRDFEAILRRAVSEARTGTDAQVIHYIDSAPTRLHIVTVQGATGELEWPRQRA